MSISIIALLFYSFSAVLIFILIGLLFRYFLIADFTLKQQNNSHSVTNKWQELFYNLFLGIVIILFCYAVWFTQFKTIFLSLIPIGLVWLYVNRVKNSLKYTDKLLFLRNYFQHSLLTPLFAFFLFNFFWLLLVNYHTIDFQAFTVMINTTEMDTIYYSRITAALSFSGNESRLNVESLINTDFAGVQLYHYFELWLTNFMATILQIPSAVIITFLLLPLFLSVMTLAITAIMATYTPNIHLGHFIASILLVYAHYLYLPIYGNMPKFEYMQNLCVHPFWGTKVGVYYFIGLSFVLALRKQSFIEAIWVLFLLPIFTVTALPSIFASSFALLIYVYYYKLVEQKNILLLAGTLLFVVALLLGIPKIFSSEYSIVPSTAKPFSNLTIAVLKSKFNLFAGSLLQTAILFLPYLLILALQLPYKFLKNNTYQLLGVLLFSMALAGAGLWALLHPLFDSIQLFIFPIQTLATCAIIFMLIDSYFSWIINTNKKIISHNNITKYLKFIAIPIFLFTVAYNINYHFSKPHSTKITYSRAYLEKIQAIIEEKKHSKEPIFVASHLDSLMRTTFGLGNSATLMRAGGYLSYMSDSFFVYSIDDLEMQANPTMLQDQFPFLAFANFASTERKNNPNATDTQLQLNFLKKYKFTYLIISKDAKLSPEIYQLARQQIRDSISGETFMVLK